MEVSTGQLPKTATTAPPLRAELAGSGLHHSLECLCECAFRSVSDILSYFGNLEVGSSHEYGSLMYPPVREIFKWALANYQLEPRCKA